MIEDDFFLCLRCGRTFGCDVWHCPGCDYHWEIAKVDECSNCHRYERSPDGMILPIQATDEDEDEEEDEEEAGEQDDEEEEAEEQESESSSDTDREGAARRWTELMSQISHINLSLNELGGVASLSRGWSRRSKEGFIRAVHDAIRTFESILQQLRETLNEAEPRA
jgi:hypothetical protein